MFQELKPDEFERARFLFSGFDYSLSIHAAIEGNNPGRIFVDDLRHPHTALALTVEGYLLAGDNGNPGTNAALRQLFKDRIFTGEVFVNGDWSLSLAVHPDSWEARLPDLIPSYEVIKLERYHYGCRSVKFDWRSNLPAGYTVRRVDQALLDDPQVVFPAAIDEWMSIEEMWWTKENFLAKAISFVVLHAGEVVAWCTPDCVAGDRMDVGIMTHPAYRRRGLGSIAVAATVEHCLNSGFSAVGWHCNAINVGSWKTAEKVGFERTRPYAYYYYMYDPVDHLAELGWFYYQRGEYNKTVQYLEQVFVLRDENPSEYYYEAASAWAWLGNKQQALMYLQKAVDRDWPHIEWTKGQPEFKILHGLPEWEAIFSKVK